MNSMSRNTDGEFERLNGPFARSKRASRIRAANEALSLRTCWTCWAGYPSRVVLVSRGRQQRARDDIAFCSRACRSTWIREHSDPAKLPPLTPTEIRAEMQDALAELTVFMQEHVEPPAVAS